MAPHCKFKSNHISSLLTVIQVASFAVAQIAMSPGHLEDRKRAVPRMLCNNFIQVRWNRQFHPKSTLKVTMSLERHEAHNLRDHLVCDWQLVRTIGGVKLSGRWHI